MTDADRELIREEMRSRGLRPVTEADRDRMRERAARAGQPDESWSRAVRRGHRRADAALLRKLEEARRARRRGGPESLRGYRASACLGLSRPWFGDEQEWRHRQRLAFVRLLPPFEALEVLEVLEQRAADDVLAGIRLVALPPPTQRVQLTTSTLTAAPPAAPAVLFNVGAAA